jgi:hypothetical protein
MIVLLSGNGQWRARIYIYSSPVQGQGLFSAIEEYPSVPGRFFDDFIYLSSRPAILVYWLSSRQHLDI